MRVKKITNEQFIEAYKTSNYEKKTTAKVLNISEDALYKELRKRKGLSELFDKEDAELKRKLLEEQKEKNEKRKKDLEEIEAVAFEKAKAGDVKMITFILSTIGKSLGYTTSQEIELKNTEIYELKDEATMEEMRKTYKDALSKI